MRTILDIAGEYIIEHEERIDAAVAFVKALTFGDPKKPRGYMIENSILATIDAFELTPRETIALTIQLTIQAASE